MVGRYQPDDAVGRGHRKIKEETEISHQKKRDQTSANLSSNVLIFSSQISYYCVDNKIHVTGVC